MFVRITMVMWILEKVDLYGVDWNYLPQYRDR
jgi:hypothetical protein